VPDLRAFRVGLWGVPVLVHGAPLLRHPEKLSTAGP
jgi:hypothetical protein